MSKTLRSRDIVPLGYAMIAALTGLLACSGNDDSPRPLDASTNDGASIDTNEDASDAGGFDSATDAELDVVDADAGGEDSGVEAGDVDAGDAAIGPDPAIAAAAAEFAKDAVNWMTTYEDATDTLQVGGSQASGTIAVRNAMRNAIRWTTSDTSHELGETTNLGMCMSAYAMKEAYPHLPSQQPIIETNLAYLQRALLATQQKSASDTAQFAFPARPGSNQYSAKTNAICGLAFLELYAFWSAIGEPAYRDDAKRAALDIGTFLSRLQEPNALPGIPSALEMTTPPDANGDGRYDGIFEEVNGGRLVMATAMWGAMAGRFFHELAGLGWTEVDAVAMNERAEGMTTFFPDGLGVGAEHYSPAFQCTGASCANKLAEYGASIAKVADFVEGSASVTGGDDAWHGRLARYAGDTVLFDNLNGSDPVQWAFNALFAMDEGLGAVSHFSDFFSQDARQLHRTDQYYLIGSDKRDIFLGLGTYIAHGRDSTTNPGTFELAAGGTTIAHYVRKDGEWQIVTSNYGDNALAGWTAASWRNANRVLLSEYALDDPNTAVFLQGEYDFGELSHLAHWAMTLDGSGGLQPKVAAGGKVTVSSENLASTLCRVLRAWHGPDACTL